MQKFYEEIMKKCLQYALCGSGTVAPNPMVGAILLDKNNEIISCGYHKMFAAPHAEVNCIENAPQNTDFKSSTLVVNLEPCSHFGKTPPCADLIIKKGIKRVVIGMVDVNEKVQGRGIKKLQNAGVEVICPILEDECKRLNKIFIKNVTKKMPFVAIKTATTLDSKIASVTNSSKWITGDCARGYVQKLRFQYDAILTGSNTVLIDNPHLTLRDYEGKNPARIVIDRNFKTNISQNVYKNDGARVIIVTNEKVQVPPHIEVVQFTNFKTLFKKLYDCGIYSILVEAGAGLNSALIKENAVDYIYNFIAPKLLGSGKNFIEGFEITDINSSLKLDFSNLEKVGDDVFLEAYFKTSL